ncbi:MAG: 50S ribosomal protein L9 [Porticoccaceae bacterium]|nr:50S ribosomal protein L9 [Porticoccaceae bacterium]
MEVILLEKAGKLGDIGDKVSVKAGYGRNYLVPQGKAVFATRENLEAFESRRAELEKAAAEKLAKAQKLAAKIIEVASITITSVAGEEGRLFGSIGPRDVAEALNTAGVEVSKSDVKMPEGAIREVGEFDIDIQLHSDLTQAIQVIVLAE